MHIDVLDEILYADDKDKGNGEEYQLIGIHAWCNRSTWITCDSYDLTINNKDKCCAPIGTGKLYNNPLITTNGHILFEFYVTFKIISAHMRRANQQVGENGRFPRKNTWHIRKQKLACLTCCQRGARTHTRHRGQILICLIHPSTREAVSPEECVLMTRTANVAFGRICANV